MTERRSGGRPEHPRIAVSNAPRRRRQGTGVHSKPITRATGGAVWFNPFFAHRRGFQPRNQRGKAGAPCRQTNNARRYQAQKNASRRAGGAVGIGTFAIYEPE